MSFSRTVFVLFLIFILSPFSTPAFAISEEEKSFLLMYFKEEEIQVISATRSLKSITRVAENVEVVTKEDIELMNAHTVAEVLNTVNGVVVSFNGGSPGAIASAMIQGSADRLVTVFLDGIPYNNLGDNFADVGEIPVQFVDRIEIIKGPASSAWGSSLGGVINIITKSPGKSPIGGMASASYGERNTGDFRAEISGTAGKLGYYAFAGRLQTDGLRSREDFAQNNLYAKLSYDFVPGTRITYSLLYSKIDRQEGDFSAYDFTSTDSGENILTSLSLNSALSRDVNLDVTLWAASMLFNPVTTIISTGDVFNNSSDDKKYGGSAKLTWRLPNNTIVLGTDYDDGKTKSTFLTSEELKLRKWAAFVNDTIVVGQFSVTPGIRYDNTNISNDFVSPSLGITYELAKNTIIRAYIARGFSLPPLGFTDSDSEFFRHNPDLKVEKVWSYQAGIETGALKYLWLKVSAFRHDIKDAIVSEQLTEEMFTYVNKDRVRRQGFEVEIKSKPIYHATFFAATTYVDSTNLDTDEKIVGVPTYTYDIGLKYDDEKSFRGLVKGRYVWWNQPSDNNAKYNAFIFDINMIKSLYKSNNHVVEAFLSGHNLLNGSQYWVDAYKNARRWIEAGIRYKF